MTSLGPCQEEDLSLLPEPSIPVAIVQLGTKEIEKVVATATLNPQPIIINNDEPTNPLTQKSHESFKLAPQIQINEPAEPLQKQFQVKDEPKPNPQVCQIVYEPPRPTLKIIQTIDQPARPVLDQIENIDEPVRPAVEEIKTIIEPIDEPARPAVNQIETTNESARPEQIQSIDVLARPALKQIQTIVEPTKPTLKIIQTIDEPARPAFQPKLGQLDQHNNKSVKPVYYQNQVNNVYTMPLPPQNEENNDHVKTMSHANEVRNNAVELTVQQSYYKPVKQENKQLQDHSAAAVPQPNQGNIEPIEPPQKNQVNIESVKSLTEHNEENIVTVKIVADNNQCIHESVKLEPQVSGANNKLEPPPQTIQGYVEPTVPGSQEWNLIKRQQRQDYYVTKQIQHLEKQLNLPTKRSQEDVDDTINAPIKKSKPNENITTSYIDTDPFEVDEEMNISEDTLSEPKEFGQHSEAHNKICQDNRMRMDMKTKMEIIFGTPCHTNKLHLSYLPPFLDGYHKMRSFLFKHTPVKQNDNVMVLYKFATRDTRPIKCLVGFESVQLCLSTLQALTHLINTGPNELRQIRIWHNPHVRVNTFFVPGKKSIQYDYVFQKKPKGGFNNNDSNSNNSFAQVTTAEPSVQPISVIGQKTVVQPINVIAQNSTDQAKAITALAAENKTKPPKMYFPKVYVTQKIDEFERYGYSIDFYKSLGIKPPLISCIVVQNLETSEDHLDAEKIRMIFMHAGNIQELKFWKRLPTSKAIIRYDHPLEAVQAISMFHNQMLCNKKMNVAMSHSVLIPYKPGLQSVGKGLGPNGEPLRGVRAHLELQEMKRSMEHMKKELEELKNNFNNLNNCLQQNNALSNQNQPNLLLGLSALLNQSLHQQGSAGNLTSAMAGVLNQNSTVTVETKPSFQQNVPMFSPNCGVNTPNIVQNAPNMNQPPPYMSQNSVAMAQNTSDMSQQPPSFNTSQNSLGMVQNSANMIVPPQHTVQNIQNTPVWGQNQMHQASNQNQGFLTIIPPPCFGSSSVNSGTGNSAQTSLQHNKSIPSYTQIASQPIMKTKPPTPPKPSLPIQYSRQEQSFIDKFTSASQRYEQKEKPRESKGSDMLLFSNLPSSVTAQALNAKMREVGELVFGETTGMGRAVVRFKQMADAERCIKLFHRSKVDGCVIDVKYF